jgi:hypothetical protein
MLVDDLDGDQEAVRVLDDPSTHGAPAFHNRSIHSLHRWCVPYRQVGILASPRCGYAELVRTISCEMIRGDNVAEDTIVNILVE